MQINSVRVTRDSFSAADNLKAPHEYIATINPSSTVEALILAIFRKLPTFDRKYGTATWAITSKRLLAIISNQWDAPRMLLRSVRRMQDMVIIHDNTAYIHFCLYEDSDPDELYQTLDKVSFPYLHESKS